MDAHWAYAFCMDLVWVFMVAAGSLTAFLTGRAQAMTSSVLDGVAQAIGVGIGLAGMFSLWMGVERLAEESGLVDMLSRYARPVLKILFPHLRPSGNALSSAAGSVLSNVLGLSSATPLGLKAMSEMEEELGQGSRGVDSMSTLVILNAAGFCLFPSTIIALRAASGSRVPALIAGPCAAAGLAATLGGLIAYRALKKLER